MFEGQANKFALAVTLTMASGERLNGSLLLNRTMKLLDALNRPDQFVEFAARDGREMVIAKDSIASAVLQVTQRTDQLAMKPEMFDAYKILGIERGTPQAAVRAAYVAKARLYHPDQFASHPLPSEVSDYLQAMFIRVQSAYDELSSRREPAETRQA